MNEDPSKRSPRKKCLISIKALHSLSTSYVTMTRFEQSINSPDHFLLSALYQNAIIKYAKPFMDMRINGIPERFQVKRIKSFKGFDKKIHDEIIKIRNTLIAHDDLDHLEPRILHNCMVIDCYSIPLETHIANKSLLYLADKKRISLMRAHISYTQDAVAESLAQDIEDFREFALRHPEAVQNEAKYFKKYGTETIEIGGTKLNPPDVTNDEYLKVEEPKSFQTKDGYFYHDINMKKSHLKPGEIQLPNGETLIISLE